MVKFMNDKGYLLVDTMIAIIILSVALVAVVGIFMQGNVAQRDSENRTVAYNLAQQKVELLKNKTAAEWSAAVPADTHTFIVVFSDAGPTSVPNNAMIFTRTTQAKIATTDTDATKNINSKLVQVQVIVSWIDSKMGNQQIAVNAYFERE